MLSPIPVFQYQRFAAPQGVSKLTGSRGLDAYFCCRGNAEGGDTSLCGTPCGFEVPVLEDLGNGGQEPLAPVRGLTFRFLRQLVSLPLTIEIKFGQLLQLSEDLWACPRIRRIDLYGIGAVRH